MNAHEALTKAAEICGVQEGRGTASQLSAVRDAILALRDSLPEAPQPASAGRDPLIRARLGLPPLPETPQGERAKEKWRDALEQRPQPCACRFEWREIPDFSGLPPKQLDECGFHAEQRRELTALRSNGGSAKVPEKWVKYAEEAEKIGGDWNKGRASVYRACAAELAAAPTKEQRK